MSRKPFMTRKETCAVLGISKNAFYEWVSAGLLRTVKLPTHSRKHVVVSASVDEALSKVQVTA